MGCEVSKAKPEEAARSWRAPSSTSCAGWGSPTGCPAVGFGPQDLDKLVAGTLPQHRVTKLSPRPAGADELRQLFLDSMTLW